MDPNRLTGLTCIVTGGAGGIGLAVAAECARLGGAVAIVDLDKDAAEDAARRIGTRFGVTTAGFAADVGDEASVSSATSEILATFGSAGVLVNCAGIITPNYLPADKVAVADFDAMLRIHVRGAFLFSRAVVPAMTEAGFGRIVNISSILGILGLPNRIGYMAAKTAIAGLTRGMAVETARHGITVNAVAPGYILTPVLRSRAADGKIDYDHLADRAPVGRWGLPEEVASAIGFLALPKSGFITGTVLPVDGGYTMRGDPGEDIGTCQTTLADIEAMFTDARI